MDPELTKLQTKYTNAYADAERQAKLSFEQRGDEYLSGEAAFEDAVRYGAMFLDEDFVRRMFRHALELFRRAIANDSYSAEEPDEITRDYEDHRKHLVVFITSNALAGEKSSANFASFDEATRLLVRALEPRVEELGGDVYGSAVVIEALSIWALAELWERPHAFGTLGETIGELKVVAQYRAIRDALVACTRGASDAALTQFDAAYAKLINPKKYDTGVVSDLTLARAYNLSVLRQRGRLMQACTLMFEES